METTFYAQPYDLSATGFFFNRPEDYAAKAAACWNDFGERVEEFVLQFVEGEAIDAALAEAVGLTAPHLAAFFEAVESWDDHQKLAVIIAVSECGYAFDWAASAPEDFDVDIYEDMTLRDVAEAFVDEGLLGEIPEQLQCYLDVDAISRDLAVDYTETEIAGRRIVFRCG
ncbi:MAG: antirestriction protein ArdA [Pseudomonadota bacterium]